VGARPPSGAFVGRRAELRALARALDEATTGAARAVLLRGEAGAGKTRLVEQVTAAAARRGLRVLAGGCVPLSGSLPFAPLADALRDVLPPLPEPAGGDRALTQAEFFEVLLRAIRSICTDPPGALLVVEDVHWADRSTLDLLAFLVANLRAERLLVLLTNRTDELPPGPGHVAALHELTRSPRLRLLDLAPFGVAELTELAAAVLGRPPPAGMVERLRSRCDGNPFLAEELLRAGFADDAAVLPRRLRDVLGSRVAGLTAPARRVLDSLAVLGRPADHDLLAEVAGLGPDALLAATREAVNARVLEADPRAGTYRFRHGLLQEVVDAELLPGEREQLHHAAARALDAVPLPVAKGDRVRAAAERALHWDRAGSGPEALAALVAAGDAAAAAHADREAHQNFEDALGWWARVPQPERAAGISRAALLERAAEAARWAGDVPRALALSREALAGAGPDGALPAETEAGLWVRVATLLWMSGDTAGSAHADERAGALLAGAPPSPVQARWLAHRAADALLQGRYGFAVTAARRAVDVGRALDARGVQSHALNLLGGALAMTGDAEGGIAALEQALALAQREGDIDNLKRSHTNLALVLAQAGRSERALAVAQDGLALLRRSGRDGGAALLESEAAQLLLQLGRWDEAAALIDGALARRPAATVELYLRVRRGWLDAVRGDLARAAVHLAAAEELADPERMLEPMFWAPLRAAQAELALWRGDPEAAAAAVRRGLDAVEGGEEHLLIARLRALGVRAAADAVHRRRALHQDAGAASASGERLAGAAARSPHPPAVADAVPELGVDAALAAAELTRLRGRPAPQRWAAVAAGFDDLRQPYPAAYARWRQAEALVDLGAPGRAATPLRAARDAAAALGARPLLREVAALTARERLDLDPAPAGSPGRARDPFGLTPREREVLTHLVEGRTNRQIARALVVTEKTAGAYVSAILAKLGVANRGEAADLARRSGLPPAAPLAG